MKGIKILSLSLAFIQKAACLKKQKQKKTKSKTKQWRELRIFFSCQPLSGIFKYCSCFVGMILNQPVTFWSALYLQNLSPAVHTIASQLHHNEWFAFRDASLNHVIS